MQDTRNGTALHDTLARQLARLPQHIRSPGFAMVAALSVPTLAVLVALGWQSSSPATAWIATAMAALALGTCVLAPLALKGCR